ncbi:DUF5362 family protein [Chitinophaga caseinilytica]|uniref:DUF5362 family protein n=1 Tax=Chitinophaga caseinilytica TaxID=2267521 RepID=UPI003C30B27C
MENQNLFDLHIDETSARFLKETAKWGRFLSILAFIVLGFYALCVLIMILVGQRASGPVMESAYGANPMSMMMATGTGLFFILLVVALMVIPVIYMYRFSTRLKVALENNDQHTLTESFSNLKSLFKFYGIYTIVVLVIMVLAFIGGIIAGASMMG